MILQDVVFWLAVLLALAWLRELHARRRAEAEVRQLARWYLADGSHVDLPVEACIARRIQATAELGFYASESTYEPDEWGEKPIDRDNGHRARRVIGQAPAHNQGA